jgi:hypothetical protein
LAVTSWIQLGYFLFHTAKTLAGACEITTFARQQTVQSHVLSEIHALQRAICPVRCRQQIMPSSHRKIASSRANGAKSSGPASELGKQVSALNALTHGLTAHTVVLFNESHDEYQTQLRDYLNHFLPQTKPETDLVHQLAAAHWRLARYAGVESGLLEQRMQSQEERFEDYDDLPHHHRLALAFSALSGANGSLALLNRYQSRLHHEYHRILKALRQIQSASDREAKLPNEPNPDSEHAPTTGNRPPAAC